jgi:hypothetical protein
MTRTIKFRCWHEAEMHNDSESKFWLSQGLPYKFMQFTGLLDKNGVEIYEGDILAVECAGGLANFEVVWEKNNARFNRANCPYLAGGLSYGDGVEIIGNIYQNPELIK